MPVWRIRRPRAKHDHLKAVGTAAARLATNPSSSCSFHAVANTFPSAEAGARP